MPDRSAYWPPPPDWTQARIAVPGLEVAPAQARVWLASGATAPFLAARGLTAVGPRDRAGDAYAARLAPDRVLVVGAAAPGGFGWRGDGLALSDLTDGWILIDLTGPDAPALMAMATSYDFAAPDARPTESCAMRLAGQSVVVTRRGEGFRLHIQRDRAAALWFWIAAALEGSP